MKSELNLIEKVAVYLARNSIAKSTPIFVYEVKKPEGLEKMIEKLEANRRK